MAKAQVQSLSSKPEKIWVYNHTNHMIGVGIRVRESGTPGSGPESRVFEFLPGNNHVLKSDLEECQATALWYINVDRIEQVGLTGKKSKGVSLEVGHYDEDFAVAATELGERMHQMRQLARAGAL